MINNELKVIEIYPKIFVYKNLFKDIDKTYALLKNSNGEEDGIFNPWTQWSEFGEYLNPMLKDIPYSFMLDDIKQLNTKTLKQEEQKLAIIELFENFYIATQDYIAKNNVDFNINKTLVNKKGEKIEEWKINGPSIARHRIDREGPIAMTYHSDYIREPITSPGYKFAITALAYFNDNYDGGEIDFVVNNEAYKYKPVAGDYLVFPSGHPELLMSEKFIYLHGVMPTKNNSKYLSRMYWMKYSTGEDLWFEKEKEFGQIVWDEMQEEIMTEFRIDNPNRIDTEGVNRLK
jgi:hypothetical protein